MDCQYQWHMQLLSAIHFDSCKAFPFYVCSRKEKHTDTHTHTYIHSSIQKLTTQVKFCFCVSQTFCKFGHILTVHLVLSLFNLKCSTSLKSCRQNTEARGECWCSPIATLRMAKTFTQVRISDWSRPAAEWDSRAMSNLILQGPSTLVLFGEFFNMLACWSVCVSTN